MNKLLILIRVLLKNSYGKAFSSLKEMAKYGLVVVCMIPLMLMMYSQFMSFFDLGMIQGGIEFGLLAMCLTSLMTVFFSFPTYLYFSGDTPRLMSLPLPAWTIVWSKTFIVFLSTVALNLIILIPMLIAGLISGAINIVGVLILVVGTLFLLFSVLFMIGSLYILIMKLFSKVLTKDAFVIISTLISIGLAIGLNVVIQSGAQQSTGMTFFDPSTVSIPTGPFIQASWLAKAAVSFDFLSLLYCIAMFAVLAWLYQFSAQKYYLKTAAVCAGSSSKKRKNKKGSDRKQPVFTEMMKTEWFSLIRIPAYMMNCLASSLIVPILFIVLILFLPSFKELSEMAEGLDISLLFPPFGLGFTVGCVCTLFLGATNMISGTVISRRGINGLKFMKSIPVSLSKQVLAGMVVGLLVTIAGSVLYLIPIKMILDTDLVFDLSFVLGTLIISLLINLGELIVDIIHPKLIWENEIQLMKNNYNSLIAMFLFWVYLGLSAGLLFLVFNGELNLFAIIYLLFNLILCAVMYWMIPKLTIRYLKNLD